ncbi:MAG: hypothetical protein JWM57_3049 [Phycisphaerales bacterium]|nr:hypothetical protein [Phycisphaerales bacterium]
MPPDSAGKASLTPAELQAALERDTHSALMRRLGPKDCGAESSTIVATPATRRPRIKPPADRGIGFGVELIRAIREGRKTQTRRLIRPQPTAAPPVTDCPTARVGERLFVREPWWRDADGRIVYAADCVAHDGQLSDAGGIKRATDRSAQPALKFRPAMYMPRTAARLWLRVESVRVERLQAITAADLAAEGLPVGQSLAMVWDGFYPGAGHRYADDPWAWVIAFAVVTD